MERAEALRYAAITLYRGKHRFLQDIINELRLDS